MLPPPTLYYGSPPGMFLASDAWCGHEEGRAARRASLVAVLPRPLCRGVAHGRRPETRLARLQREPAALAAGETGDATRPASLAELSGNVAQGWALATRESGTGWRGARSRKW